jgi:hypothetical protein
MEASLLQHHNGLQYRMQVNLRSSNGEDEPAPEAGNRVVYSCARLTAK